MSVDSDFFIIPNPDVQTWLDRGHTLKVPLKIDEAFDFSSLSQITGEIVRDCINDVFAVDEENSSIELLDGRNILVCFIIHLYFEIPSVSIETIAEFIGDLLWDSDLQMLTHVKNRHFRISDAYTFRNLSKELLVLPIECLDVIWQMENDRSRFDSAMRIARNMLIIRMLKK
ncbi:hypothetical protein AAKU58_003960 [Oxalobacteraceae bacterium GrIS 1.18]